MRGTLPPTTSTCSHSTAGTARRGARAIAPDAARWRRHPLSRWYLCPWADRFATRLAASRVRADHLTFCGLGCAALAALWLLLMPATPAVAAWLVMIAWFFDRADGQLARLQGKASARGAWLDANCDELVDFGLHAAMAHAAWRVTGSPWAWYLLLGFFAGKYLLMHGLATEAVFTSRDPEPAADDVAGTKPLGWVRRLYHLPGNADVRVHLAAIALATGTVLPELALLAVYYNVRWIVRYPLAAGRLGGAA